MGHRVFLHPLGFYVSFLDNKSQSLLPRQIIVTMMSTTCQIIGLPKLIPKTMKSTAAKSEEPTIVREFIILTLEWKMKRKGRDSNPRNAINVNTLSRRASSTTPAPFRNAERMIGKDCWKSNPLLCVPSFCNLKRKEKRYIIALNHGE
jgi:hypothetical protein